MSTPDPTSSEHELPPAGDVAPAERAVRRRVLKSGLICFNTRHSTLPCAVRDLSERGAKLTVSGSIGVPDTFELYVELDGLWAECEVVWRRADVIGVAFTSPVTIEPPKRKQILSCSTQEQHKPTLRRAAKR